MMFLLIVATIVAPIAALIFADWWRQRRRNRAHDKNFRPGWVAEEINKFKREKTKP